MQYHQPDPFRPPPARSFQYQYDALGNRLSAGEQGGSTNDQYTVDSLNQYSSKTNPALRIIGNANVGSSVGVPGVVVGQLDRNYGGELVMNNQNASGPAQGTLSVSMVDSGGGATVERNWFIPALNQAFSYDADGNMTSDGVWTYSYDAENRLIRMASALPAGFGDTGETITFNYDYLGRRVEKQVATTQTDVTTDRRYIYDGTNLVAEIDGYSGDATYGNLMRSYAWGLDLAGSLDASGGVGALLEITNYNYSGSSISATNYLPAFDGNGNVSVLLNGSTGEVAAAYEYAPFGEPLRNQCFDSGISDNPFRFSTKYTDVETGLVYYGARYYSPTLGRFINRDPIEEAGGVNLYGFCGNDPTNGVDVMGHGLFSWLSSLWDHTVGWLGRKIAQDWDHGRQYIEMGLAIVASCFVGFEVAAMVDNYLLSSDLVIGTLISENASVGLTTAVTGGISAVVGGAAGGFVSGVSLAAIGGDHLGQALEAGLKGAEYGAIQGGITAGLTDLNSTFSDYTKVQPFKDFGTDINDLQAIAAHGLEGAITNELENKDPSAGFWSGTFGALSSGFDPKDSFGWFGNDLAKGLVGGLSSMNKAGSGFMNGFWSAEATVATTAAGDYFKAEKLGVLDQDLLDIAAKGLAGGAVSRFGRKTFAAGLIPGAEGEALSDLLSYMEVNPEKPPSSSASGPANSAYKLLQPKTTKKGVAIPLETIKGGSWANGANWAQLY